MSLPAVCDTVRYTTLPVGRYILHTLEIHYQCLQYGESASTQDIPLLDGFFFKDGLREGSLHKHSEMCFK